MEHLASNRKVDRLTELVIHLSGADGEVARIAVEDSIEIHGDWGDSLLNVAEALVTLRNDAALAAEPERAEVYA